MRTAGSDGRSCAACSVAVVDADEFEVGPRDLREGGDETAMRLGKNRFLLEAGDDHGQEGGRAHLRTFEFDCPAARAKSFPANSG